MSNKSLPIIVVFLGALVVSGCGGVSSARRIDYRNTQTLPTLEVPPDLTALPEQNVPGATAAQAGSATYSGYAGDKRTQPGTFDATVLPQYPDVKLARDGQTRYVVVQAEPAKVWEQLREFFPKNGLPIASDNPRAGLMETEWAENRALVGANEEGILTKWLANMFSTGQRDKYRVRLERGVVPGTTEIYLTHKGMEEVAPDQAGAARPGWLPRPSDPELEARMLALLVAHIGGERSAERAIAQATAPSTTAADAAEPNARMVRNGSGAPLLSLEDSLDRAWRRVGLSLDRIGFTVEDRDRSKGIYYVRYIDPETKEQKRGLFSRLFGTEEAIPPSQYQVHVKPGETGTNVEVLDNDGTPEASKAGERILSLLYEQLK